MRTLPTLKTVLFVSLLLGCSKPTNTSSADTAASAAHLASLDVCKLVVSAKIGSACQHMDSPGGGADASQFTMPGTPAHKGELFGASFTYAAAAEYEAALTKFKSEKVGANRAAPLVLSNANALTIVVADGEMRAADVDPLKKIVDTLH